MHGENYTFDTDLKTIAATHLYSDYISSAKVKAIFLEVREGK